MSGVLGQAALDFTLKLVQRLHQTKAESTRATQFKHGPEKELSGSYGGCRDQPQSW